jgi:hypothetical protein
LRQGQCLGTEELSHSDFGLDNQGQTFGGNLAVLVLETTVRDAYIACRTPPHSPSSDIESWQAPDTATGLDSARNYLDRVSRRYPYGLDLPA